MPATLRLTAMVSMLLGGGVSWLLLVGVPDVAIRQCLLELSNLSLGEVAIFSRTVVKRINI